MFKKEPYVFLLLVCGGHLKKNVKALPRFFLCIFSSIACLQKPVFSKRGSSAVEGTSQAVLDSFDQWKVPASQPVTISKK
jgi:hypothetical protein